MAASNGDTKPLQVATAMIRKGNHKLTRYWGYDRLDGEECLELYNLEEDPGELENLADTQKGETQSLLQALMAAIRRADEPYG